MDYHEEARIKAKQVELTDAVNDLKKRMGVIEGSHDTALPNLVYAWLERRFPSLQKFSLYLLGIYLMAVFTGTTVYFVIKHF